MGTEAMAEARARAQDAQSRARLATDPEAKRAWQKRADEWIHRLAELKAGQHESDEPAD